VNKIILADSQVIYRAGAARVLAGDEDMRIVAQCGDLGRMYRAILDFPGSEVVFAASLRPELARLRILLETTGSRGTVIAECNDSAWAYLEQGFLGVVFRNVSGPILLECVRRVAAGDTWLPAQLTQSSCTEVDTLGRRVLDRLTQKELGVMALIVQGCKNREIASRLGTTEQVIKNHLRSVFGKAGVNDRLDLALFTIRHPVLSKAVAEVGSELDVQEGPYAGDESTTASSGNICESWDLISGNGWQDNRHIS